MLRELRWHWEQFGRKDPLWAALTWKDKSEGRWSADEFFRNGEIVVANLLHRAAELGIEIPRNRALDFGCGPGRLTQALAAHFGSVDGVDIAQRMIANARRFNRYGDRCRYCSVANKRLSSIACTGTLPASDKGSLRMRVAAQVMLTAIERRRLETWASARSTTVRLVVLARRSATTALNHHYAGHYTTT